MRSFTGEVEDFIYPVALNDKYDKTYYIEHSEKFQEELLKEKIHAERIEGVKSSGWILMDYNDVVVHVFSKEDRLFYDLERIWKDGKIIEL